MKSLLIEVGRVAAGEMTRVESDIVFGNLISTLIFGLLILVIGDSSILES